LSFLGGFVWAFYGLLVASGLFFILFIHSFLRYKIFDFRDDLNAAISAVIIAILILTVNMVSLYPLNNYDVLSYYVSIDTNATSTVVLPWPDEPSLFDEILVDNGECEWKVVDTEKGMGLEIKFSWRLYLESDYTSRDRKLDFEPDLMEGGNFSIHFESEDINASCRIREFRIVHQSPTDFHSKQIIIAKNPLQQGWNSIKYQYYTG
jgi:hypothetical protein